ncbi:XPG i-region domain-containing protein [Ditylenchus destructor]|uniref:Flap endonuclease 1 n=1 Tax=Ditylenchus destructor TaxID=166010 RepID=A0AAD4MJD8_9BILA|nr:XPG i-region domain-containing protein [Ditylenchus destructor]
MKDLSKVLGDHAASAIRTNEMKAYFGRKIAIDASMSLYQFLIAVRQDGAPLMDDNGETTSHLYGMFFRTIRMMENGIKPVFVFDGKPPQLKSAELQKRTDRRSENEILLTEAKDKGDATAVEKFERRSIKVSPKHNDECKKLLRLMGVPVVDAPCEAEAQCAELVRTDKVYATATEDMDALTFGSKILVRHMSFSEAKKVPIQEFSLEKILKCLEFTFEQFVDFCILLCCDYCPSIRGIGPKKAFELISQHKSIENILENIDQEKYPPPENWLFAAARNLFLHPEVTNGEEIQFAWTEPNLDEIIKFLCVEKGFNEDRIRTAIDRLKKSRTIAQQGRIDTFFKATATVTTVASSQKRKSEETKQKTKPDAAGKKRRSGNDG